MSTSQYNNFRSTITGVAYYINSYITMNLQSFYSSSNNNNPLYILMTPQSLLYNLYNNEWGVTIIWGHYYILHRDWKNRIDLLYFTMANYDSNPERPLTDAKVHH